MSSLATTAGISAFLKNIQFGLVQFCGQFGIVTSYSLPIAPIAFRLEVVRGANGAVDGASEHVLTDTEAQRR